jgi:hypothetical protein
MSRTSQKKKSAYQLGFDDGLLGNGSRWARHPQLDFYEEGYREGHNARLTMPPPRMTLIQRIKFVFFGIGPHGESYIGTEG